MSDRSFTDSEFGKLSLQKEQNDFGHFTSQKKVNRTGLARRRSHASLDFKLPIASDSRSTDRRDQIRAFIRLLERELSRTKAAKLPVIAGHKPMIGSPINGSQIDF